MTEVPKPIFLGSGTERQKLKCDICFELVTKAVRCSNPDQTDVFCESCLHNWIESNATHDPRCQREQLRLTIDGADDDNVDNGANQDAGDQGPAEEQPEELFTAAESLEVVADRAAVWARSLLRNASTIQRVAKIRTREKLRIRAASQVQAAGSGGTGTGERMSAADQIAYRRIGHTLVKVDDCVDHIRLYVDDVLRGVGRTQLVVKPALTELRNRATAGEEDDVTLRDKVKDAVRRINFETDGVEELAAELRGGLEDMKVRVNGEVKDVVKKALEAAGNEQESRAVDSRLKRDVLRAVETLRSDALRALELTGKIVEMATEGCSAADELRAFVLEGVTLLGLGPVRIGRIRLEVHWMHGPCPTCHHVGEFQPSPLTDDKVDWLTVRCPMSNLFGVACRWAGCYADYWKHGHVFVTSAAPGRSAWSGPGSGAGNGNNSNNSQTTEHHEEVDGGGNLPIPKFLDAYDVIQQLECSICYQVVKTATRCANQHLFCHSCVMTWIESQVTTDVSSHLEQLRLTIADHHHHHQQQQQQQPGDEEDGEELEEEVDESQSQSQFEDHEEEYEDSEHWVEQEVENEAETADEQSEDENNLEEDDDSVTSNGTGVATVVDDNDVREEPSTDKDDLFRLVKFVSVNIDHVVETTYRLQRHATTAVRLARLRETQRRVERDSQEEEEAESGQDELDVAAGQRSDRITYRGIERVVEALSVEYGNWVDGVEVITTSAEIVEVFVMDLLDALGEASTVSGGLESVLVSELRQVVGIVDIEMAVFVEEIHEASERSFPLNNAVKLLHTAIEATVERSRIDRETSSDLLEELEEITKDTGHTVRSMERTAELIGSVCQLVEGIADLVLENTAGIEARPLRIGRVRFTFCGATGRCPMCRHLGSFQSAPDTDRRVEDLQVACPVTEGRRGRCSWTGRLGEYAGHTHSFVHRIPIAEVTSDVSNNDSSSNSRKRRLDEEEETEDDGEQRETTSKRQKTDNDVLA